MVFFLYKIIKQESICTINISCLIWISVTVSLQLGLVNVNQIYRTQVSLELNFIKKKKKSAAIK